MGKDNPIWFNSLSRREFLKWASAGVVGLGLAAFMPPAEPPKASAVQAGSPQPNAGEPSSAIGRATLGTGFPEILAPDQRLEKLLKEADPAINFLDKVTAAVMRPADFYDGKIHQFAPERVRRNVQFKEAKTFGGGSSALFDYHGNPDRPMTLYGPYSSSAIDRVRESAAGGIFITNYVHEGFIHPMQDLVHKTSTQGVAVTEHSSMGLLEDLVRQQYGIGWMLPDQKLVYALDKAVANGMDRQEAITTTSRLAFGKTDEAVKLATAYGKKLAKGDPTWGQLWAPEYKLKLSDDEAGKLFNPLRQAADKMFGVPFTAY